MSADGATGSDAADEPSSQEEQHFLFGMAKDRLLSACLWGGLVLALSPIIPYEEVDGVPQFLWQLLSELPPAAIVAAFSPSAVGVALIVARRFTKRPSSLAVWVLAGLVWMALMEKIGSDRARWGLVDLPSSIYGRPLFLLSTLAGTGAGLRLAQRHETRKLGRGVLGAAAAAGVVFYLLPQGAEAPLGTLIRLAMSLPQLPNFRFVLGALLLGSIAGFPLLVAALGGWFAYRPPTKEPRYLALLATYGFPLLLGSLAFRTILLTLGDASLIGTAGGIALLTALLGLAAATLEVLLPALARLVRPGAEATSVSTPDGWRPQRVLTVAASVVLAGSALQWWLARPPEKGVAWKLGPRTPPADELFGDLVPAWGLAQNHWQTRARDQSSAQGMVSLKASGHAMLKAARPLNTELERTLRQLTLESRDLDLAGRRWFRLVHEINAASQHASLPYYVDPSVLVRSTSDGLSRIFQLHAYHIESVHPVSVSGRAFATLRVRSLGAMRQHHNLLGFSRDIQPFALVVLDEIEPFAEHLAELGAMQPPRCLEDVPPGTEPALRACGKLLRELFAAGSLRAQLLALTERHELQHQIDGPLLPHAQPVLRRLARFHDRAQDRVNRELSAYVAELTASDASPKLGLIHLFRFAMAGQRGTLTQVSVLALEALTGRELGGHVFEPDKAQLAGAFLELSALSDEALRKRAADAWNDLYGDALPKIQPR